MTGCIGQNYTREHILSILSYKTATIPEGSIYSITSRNSPPFMTSSCVMYHLSSSSPFR